MKFSIFVSLIVTTSNLEVYDRFNSKVRTGTSGRSNCQDQQAIQKATKDVTTAETDSKAIDKNFSNEVRMNTSTYSGMMDTAISVRQQQQLLSERQNSWRHASRQLDVLKRLEKRPYFARIDFHEEGEKHETHIGLGSFSDTPEHFDL